MREAFLFNVTTNKSTAATETATTSNKKIAATTGKIAFDPVPPGLISLGLAVVGSLEE